jgi:hypothetical protein
MYDSKFDIFQDGRWHRFAFLFTGNTEVTAMGLLSRKSGRR